MAKLTQLQEIEKRMDRATDIVQNMYRNGRFANRGKSWMTVNEYETIQSSLNDIPALLKALTSLSNTRISSLLYALQLAELELQEYHQAKEDGRILPEGIHLTIMGDCCDGTYVSVSSDTHLGANL